MFESRLSPALYAILLLALAVSLVPSTIVAAPDEPSDDPVADRGDAYSRLMRSLFAARRGEFRAAVNEIRKAVELQPDSPQVYIQGAELLLELRMYSEAELMARRALEVAPDDPGTLKFLAAMVAERALRSGDRPDVASAEEAFGLYSKLAESDPLDADSLRQLTQLRLRIGDFDGAIEPARELADQRPGDVEVARVLAGLLVQQGRAQEALEQLLAFVSRHPDELLAIEDADRLAGDLGEWNLVVETLAPTLMADERPRAAHALVGEALLRIGDVPRATVALERALAAHSAGRRVRLRLVLAYRSQGRLADAVLLARSLAEDSSDQPEVAFLLAETLQAQRDIEGALEAYQLSMSMVADDPGTTQAAFRDRIRRRMAALYSVTDRPEQTMQLISELETDLEYEDFRLRGELALKADDWSAARNVAREMRAMGGTIEQGEAARIEGAILARTGKVAKAEERFDEAIRLVGPYARYSIAQIYHDVGYPDLGEALLRGWVEDEPEEPNAHFELGRYLYLIERFDEMEAAMRESFRLDPAHAPSLNFLGYSLAERRNRLAEALELVQRALEVDSWDGAYLDSLGWVYYQMGRLEDARAPLERAAREYPADPVILEHLGDVYHGLGETEMALTAWTRALDSGGADAEALSAKIAAFREEAARRNDPETALRPTDRPVGP